MDLIADYSDEEPVEQAEAASKAVDPEIARRAEEENAKILARIASAPAVSVWDADKGKSAPLAHDAKAIYTNPTVDVLHKPIEGPVHPSRPDSLYKGMRNHTTGHIEKAAMSHFSFHNEYHSFHSFGVCADPSDNVNPMKRSNIEVPKGVDMSAIPGFAVTDGGKTRKKQKVQKGAGKWGGFEDSQVKQEAIDAKQQEIKGEAADAEAAAAADAAIPETTERVVTTFHGKSETDYQGRSWMAAPASSDKKEKDFDEAPKCYLPKKWVHSWTGHSMGVNCIKLFPKTGHLLLSASMDSKVMIWDYYNQRKCLRTYSGHDQAVRDINFTNDGKQFYSASYDKTVCLWDTETGKIVTQMSNKKTPYTCTVHPDDDKQNIVISGCVNKKAVQWDSRAGEIVQEYDEHLGAVNTVTFLNGGRQLMTTSDDKKIFIWEYNIPVVTRYISEHYMFSVPAVTLHPSGKWLCGQSMDNKIITYEAVGKFKFQPKRQFKGHICAGYAIRPAFSADGNYVMSGDCDGKVWFWDFHKMKNYRTIKAHDGVCIDAVWHPLQPSRCLTAGWDGVIKLWD